MSIHAHQHNIVAILHALFPKADVDAHSGRFTPESLADYRTKAPAIRVAVTAGRKARPQYDGSVLLEVKVVCAVIAKDTGKLKRDEAVSNMVAAMLLSLPSAAFDIGGHLDALSADNLWSKTTGAKGVAIWGVHWMQDIVIENPMNEDGSVLTGLYLGMAPEIGPDHEADYDRIAGPIQDGIESDD